MRCLRFVTIGLLSAASFLEADDGLASPPAGVEVRIVASGPATTALPDRSQGARAAGWRLGRQWRAEGFDLDPSACLAGMAWYQTHGSPRLSDLERCQALSLAQRCRRQWTDADPPPRPARPGSAPATSLDLDSAPVVIGWALGESQVEVLVRLQVTLDMEAFSAGFLSGWQGEAVDPEPLLAACAVWDGELETRRRRQNQAAAAAAERFLADYARRPDAVRHPSGVMMRILHAGAGAPPDGNDVVLLRYTMQTLDGRCIEETTAPVRLPMPSLLAGLQAVMLGTAPGTRLDLAIPGRLAFGDEWTSVLPGDSLVRCEVELVSVERLPGLVP